LNRETRISAATCYSAILPLADERVWRIAAADHYGQIAVQRLRDVMRLASVGNADFELVLGGRGLVDFEKQLRQITASRCSDSLVRHLGNYLVALFPLSMCLYSVGGRFWLDGPVGGPDLRIQLCIIAQTIARQVQDRGGMLLHGALAERDGAGLVLAGPSGIGKTTASNRLSPPWRSRSDDAVLIVKGADGRYWAHPWPTWSRISRSCSVDPSWDVQRAVPLAAVCFLGQSEADAITPMGAGNAAGLLAQSAEQAAVLMPYTSVEDRRAKRVQRLDNACALARSVPAYQLELSLRGAFWRLLEDEVLAVRSAVRSLDRLAPSAQVAI